jgi:hypothetical protein
VEENREATSYLDLIDRIHLSFLPRTYVEVGVRHGKSMQFALPGTKVVGIDPAYNIKFPIPRDAQLFKLTSEEFFSQHDLQSLFGGLPVDVSFIDGLHLFENALQDFISLEKYSARDSVVLAHDCYPIDRASASRTRQTQMWTGDVWKLIVCLNEYRPDLRITTVDVPPSGLGIITNLDSCSTILLDHYDEIVQRFMELDYDFLLEDKEEKLNRLPNVWNLIAERFPAHPYRQADVNTLVRRRMVRFLPHTLKRHLRSTWTWRMVRNAKPHIARRLTGAPGRLRRRR